MTKYVALTSEDFMVPSTDQGIDLFIRNKRPRDMSEFSTGRTVLFVHGATYPASTSFDLALDGRSWMDHIAERGFDVYLLDLRGYGRSSRPPEMDAPAEQNPPLVRGDVALRDLATAVDFVRKRRAISQLCLMGWSWGTTIVGAYASRNPADVARLVLYAPLWIREPAIRAGSTTLKLGAYRTVLQSDAQARWLEGVPEDARKSLIPNGWFEKWADETWATDPKSLAVDPPVLRAPNGIIQDVSEFFYAGCSYYNPEDIIAPTLIVTPEWDHDTPPYMAEALSRRLIRSTSNKLACLPEGTHSMLMERNRDVLFAEVQAFLET